MSETRTVIVLAAGEGKRMRSALPKPLHPLLGRSMIGHVLHATAPLGALHTLVVVGHGADAVRDHVNDIAPKAQTVLQAEQHGTGHAARLALEAVPDVSGTVVVICADTPLLRPETLLDLVGGRESASAAATVLSARVADPSGLGRIVRDEDGSLRGIVEDRDATDEQRAVNEINSGMYAFDAAALRDALGRLTRDNAQGEEYLTDVLAILAADGGKVGAIVASDPDEVLGVNDRAQLAACAAIMRDRVNGDLMRSGVTMIDPATTWVDVTVTVGRDALIEPNTQLRGATSIGEGASIGPDTTLLDVYVGPGASVIRTHATEAEIGPRATVGPFSFLRPGTRLGDKGKIGAYVETKNAVIGDRTKVPHLSYVGDATIGVDANIGAGTIFVNYDGVNKNHTTVGDAAFIGCDTSLVAPVTVGDGAYVAAGSAVTKDVPPGALAVSRASQRDIEGWVRRRRAGTKSAKAAEEAEARSADQEAKPSDGE
jgi:bifunctional UDP-N-acetylglucosamine pyrophosphorylase / glucosamine-1-phosphate N-acetyltransferase